MEARQHPIATLQTEHLDDAAGGEVGAEGVVLIRGLGRGEGGS